MLKRNKSHSGFTLIELLVVTTIIIILAAIGLVSFSSAGKTARDGRRKSDMETVRQALVLYRSQNSSYPNGAGTAGSYLDLINTLTTGPSSVYLSQPTPKDPKNPANTGSSNIYIYAGSATGFCLCAQMEDASHGNSSGNCSSFSNTGTTYCVGN